MTNPRHRLALAAAVAALLVLAPAAARGQACGNQAAFGLYGSSYMDSQLNPPPGEDVEFFSSTGGVPTIYFLVDNSSSMLRLPPNGPGFYASPLPPLNDVNCSGSGDSYDPGCANQLAPRSGYSGRPPGVMGCGIDSVSAAYAGGGTAIGDIMIRSFAPTCGKALNPGAYLAGYDATRHYAHEASVCPYFSTPLSGWATQPRLDGYDPDFYCGSTGTTTTCSGVGVNLFDENMVFHEAIGDGANYPGGTNLAYGFNGTAPFDPRTAPGNGWDETLHDNQNSGVRVFPFRTSAGIGTASAFCAEYAARMADVGVTAQGGQPVLDICNTCLTQRGFFFDGYQYRQSQDGVEDVPYASIWLTGNYLNFFPPKFLVARKALKDILINNLHMRSGISTFGRPSRCTSGAAEIQPLNPTCNNVYDSNANLWSNRNSFMTAINKMTFDPGTPIGLALLDLAQQFRSPGATWFANDGESTPASCLDSDYGSPTSNMQKAVCFPCQNTSIVIISDGRPKPSDDMSAYFPQGTASATDATGTCSSTHLASCIGAATAGVSPGPDATSCPQCQGAAAGGTSPFGPNVPFPNSTEGKEFLNNAIRVSWLVHNFDFRQDDETGYACNLMNGKQVLNVYTLGFGTSFSSDATALLGAMARVGGGIFVAAQNPAELGAAFQSILQTIQTRATSFSVASVSALQATASQSVVVPRFNPAKTAFWNGHLYRFELFSEYTAGCVAGGSGDLDCDCACTSVFLKDSEGSFISEDATGTFRKNTPDLPNCGASNKCATCGTPSKTALAVPYWDAADRLASRSWKSRAVYTVVDDPSALDGHLDAADPVLAIIDPGTGAFVATTITDLLPYMGLTLAAGGNCDKLGGQLSGAGDSVGAAAVGRDLATCAKAYLAYLLGADLLNEDLNGNTTTCRYPPASPGVDGGGNAIWDPLALCDRGPPNGPGKLGDIFHSSPVRVFEPAPSTSLLSSYNNQTLSSLWLTSTLNDSTSRYAYDDYAAAYATRRRFVLVGANDGLLHAFDAGNWRAFQDDPALLSQGVHTSLAPFNGYFDKGTGDELWAFLPPDLLSKVPLMLGNQHHFFVDGDPMVRDVWVDGGTANAAGAGTASADDKKQPSEFHTLVVAAERRGGTHYFALDVTDAARRYGESGFRAPRFLWIYPQPNDPQELELGETYTGFLPNPPPIGPVRLDATTTPPSAVAGVTPIYQDSGGNAVPVHERWVVFLSGGFDPQYLRGRGVHMLDVWSGQELFRFTRPSDAVCLGSTDPRCHLDAPVPATVSMLAMGKTSRGDQAYPANGGFFDTATFGDTNGALWTLRFNDPGKIGANGRVDGHGLTNWFGARSFQFSKASPVGLCSGRQPFFYSTANVPLYSSNRLLRVLAGTGDRFNQLDQYGGTCGPDNLRACMLRGCNVSVASSNNRVTVDDLLGTQGTGFSATACALTAGTTSSGTPGSQCTSIQGRVDVQISNCLNFDNTAQTATAKTYSVDCAPSGDGATCAPTATTQVAGEAMVQSTALSYNNWYLSVRVFDDSGNRAPFTSAAQAAAYDTARLDVSDLTSIDGSSTTPAIASADSRGWAMYFLHDVSFTDPASSKVYNIAKADERTASPSSTPGDSCIYWNTVQPSLLPKSAQCPCTYQNTDRLMYYYGASIASGAMCLKNITSSGTGTTCTTSSTNIRSRAGTTLTTPAAPQTTYFVSKTGQVSVGLVSVQVGSGASSVATGVINDAVRPVNWVPISRGLESCRHSSGAPVSTSCP